MRYLIGLVLVLAGCGGNNVDGPCASWCALVEECTDASVSECTEACTAELGKARSVSSQCEDAVTGQNACVGELECAEFDAWYDEDPPDAYPCEDADDVVANACVVSNGGRLL
jgi:hypothetical protein